MDDIKNTKVDDKMQGMRRIRQKLQDDEVREILYRAPYGVLSTSCEDGQPYGVPLSFVLTGLTIYFHAAATGQKLHNLKRDGRVCLTVVDEAKNMGDELTMAYRSVMVFGSVIPVQGEDERQAAFRLLSGKYAPGLSEENTAAYIKRHGPAALVLRMDVEYMTGKGNLTQHL